MLSANTKAEKKKKALYTKPMIDSWKLEMESRVDDQGAKKQIS